jgi:hypothetical protein
MPDNRWWNASEQETDMNTSKRCGGLLMIYYDDRPPLLVALRFIVEVLMARKTQAEM